VADKKGRKGLGRGLSALMADVGPAETQPAQSARRPDMMVPVERVRANPDQPRRTFGELQLQELAASIREKGIIQPLIVRPSEGDYEIVAGERRWRAAQLAQLHEIPVIVREFDDTEVLEVAIIENIQRADLNPLEEAMSYRQLMDKFGHTQEKLAEALSKSRSHIANLMRLLQLPGEVQELVREGALTAGHARALITAHDPAGLARQVVAKGLSVRETERLAKAPAGTPSSKASPSPEKSADTKALEQDLSANLGLKVVLDHRDGQESGQLTIRYKTLDELDALGQLLSTNPLAKG